MGWIQFLGHRASRLGPDQADRAIQQAIPTEFQVHGVTGYNDSLEAPEQFVDWMERALALVDATSENRKE